MPKGGNEVAEMHDVFARFRKQPLALPVAVSAATLSAILIGSAFAHGVHGEAKKALDLTDAAPLTVANAVDLSTPFARIAKEIGPAVVNINTEILPHQIARAERGPAARDDEGDDGTDNQSPGMQDFFNRFFGGMPGMDGRNQQQQEQRALGSGFIVDSHGYIVTAAHVIEKADRIYVKLSTDPESEQGHRARMVGLDKSTDLAVIKIDVDHSLPTVKLGNSDAAQPGDSVEAIGSPFDLAQTVTAGIVSAKDRRIDGGVGGQFKHFIQTDASINPGNSGGPLLNMNGQVIGVNDAILTQSAGSMGIGFAIPSNTVADVYNQLIGPEHKVVRGSIGITFQPNLNKAVAKMYDAQSGVLISSVTPGQAAEKAGLKANDVIVSVDGKPVKNGDELVETITARHPGSKVTIGYLRNGQKMTTTCTVSDRAEIEQARNDGSSDDTPGAPSVNPSKAKLGLTVADLPDNAPAGLHGVVVQSVTPGSFADELRPQVGPGAIIEGINRKPVKDRSQFNAIVAGLRSGEDVVLQIAYPKSGGQATLTGGVLP
jgi:serine protease Do